jgi:hypothetical protein
MTLPDPIRLLDAVVAAINEKINGPTGGKLTIQDWKRIIGNAIQDGGLGYTEKTGWALRLKDIVEHKLYSHSVYGKDFKNIVVTEALVDETRKTTLNVVSMKLVMIVFEAEVKASTPTA